MPPTLVGLLLGIGNLALSHLAQANMAMYI